MRRNVSLLLFVFAALLALAACRPGQATLPTPPAADRAAASVALMTFFDLLQAGDYAEAAGYYGGSYELLTGYNPNVDPSDLATLWRNGCSANGLNCLTVRALTPAASEEPGVIAFDVQFSTREGELFVIGPCCGADETEQPPVSLFTVRVARGDDGRYRVIDLPPYRP